MSGFAQRFSDLPETLPIFPLGGALLLPGGRLSLNIFEPRYLNMIDDALRSDRLIGMIQPTDSGDPPDLFPVGCAGRLVQFAETDDGRYLIGLGGLFRFRVGQELETMRGYRRIQPDWTGFENDLDDAEELEVDRERLTALLQRYFDQQGLGVDWESLQQADDDALITVLAMNCPFEVPEKQALLEADNLQQRAEIVIALLEMALADAAGNGDGASH